MFCPRQRAAGAVICYLSSVRISNLVLLIDLLEWRNTTHDMMSDGGFAVLGAALPMLRRCQIGTAAGSLESREEYTALSSATCPKGPATLAINRGKQDRASPLRGRISALHGSTVQATG